MTLTVSYANAREGGRGGRTAATASSTCGYCIRALAASLLLLPALPLQVVKQELTPEMTMHACNNPRIRGDALNRAVAKLVAEHAKAEYA